ncbi:ABC transporter ATP-binding protein [Mesorhizobium loti]|uniref:ABC transporter ATP-binding protein n=1 Tax=Rhizobium loti TaxID=381 RepID=UPI001FE4881B|nr:ATP-binding cassette domain-containing protein [Mesorhizobium loti]
MTLSAPGRRRSALGGNIAKSGTKQVVQALDDVSFELKAGDRLGLVGPNGAGKTTLLKVLYGIYQPSGGTISIAGKVDALFNIHIGFRPEATGRRNIVLRGLISGWTAAEIEEKMEEIIDFSELGDFIDLPFKAYSQGMAARLAFAAATALEPEILLMDEWIGAGDASFQEKAKRRMDELAEKAGIIVLASHDDALIQRVCTKKMTLRAGRVESLT